MKDESAAAGSTSMRSTQVRADHNSGSSMRDWLYTARDRDLRIGMAMVLTQGPTCDSGCC